eukprot:TRINITY_DN680815_c3_g1_i1.p1 TRINITY_DN680815_c3_g1~~TRINITY_DN680815_c3_g1_i1.p1  ORF type:complete len:270 (+),score=69.10 TRINITY_DN680815_c3_g1_i1:222-1031(+)
MEFPPFPLDKLSQSPLPKFSQNDIIDYPPLPFGNEFSGMELPVFGIKSENWEIDEVDGVSATEVHLDPKPLESFVSTNLNIVKSSSHLAIEEQQPSLVMSTNRDTRDSLFGYSLVKARKDDNISLRPSFAKTQGCTVSIVKDPLEMSRRLRSSAAPPSLLLSKSRSVRQPTKKSLHDLVQEFTPSMSLQSSNTSFTSSVGKGFASTVNARTSFGESKKNNSFKSSGVFGKSMMDLNKSRVKDDMKDMSFRSRMFLESRRRSSMFASSKR